MSSGRRAHTDHGEFVQMSLDTEDDAEGLARKLGGLLSRRIMAIDQNSFAFADEAEDVRPCAIAKGCIRRRSEDMTVFHANANAIAACAFQLANRMPDVPPDFAVLWVSEGGDVAHIINSVTGEECTALEDGVVVCDDVSFQKINMCMPKRAMTIYVTSTGSSDPADMKKAFDAFRAHMRRDPNAAFLTGTAYSVRDTVHTTDVMFAEIAHTFGSSNAEGEVEPGAENPSRVVNGFGYQLAEWLRDRRGYKAWRKIRKQVKNLTLAVYSDPEVNSMH